MILQKIPMFGFKEICMVRISEIKTFKFFRNLFIALISISWLLPLLDAGETILRYMIWLNNYMLDHKLIEQKDYFFGVRYHLFQ